MGGVDAGIEDPDKDPVVSGVDGPGQIGLDHRQAPGQGVQWIHSGGGSAVAGAACAARVDLFDLGIRPLDGLGVRKPADRTLAGRAEHGLRRRDGLDEVHRQVPGP